MENILIVDDEPGIVEICERTLKRRGYKVFTAFNGEEALKILEREPIELALVDLRMPQYDGNELLKRVKQSFPFTEVIIVTAEATLDAAIESLKNGAFDYILKPFNLTELTAAVKRALEYTNLRRKESIFAETTYLSKIANDIDKYHSIDDLLKLILERSLKLLDAETGTVFVIDPGSKTLRPVYTLGYELSALKGAKLGEQLLKTFAGKNEPALFSGKPDGGFIIQDYYTGAGSAILLPLSKHEILLGAILLVRMETSRYPGLSKNDLEALHVFATHASLLVALQHKYPLAQS